MREVLHILKYVLLDILLTVLVLGIFFLFQYTLPHLRMRQEGLSPVVIETPVPSPVVSEPLSWREKFSEHFSKETVVTENSYKSDNVSITITPYTSDDPCLTYYVADIYVADISNIASGYSENMGSRALDILSADNNALLAVNGDYFTNQLEGLLVRNGDVYLTEQTDCDICVLYYDGSMVTYGPEEYKAADVLAAAPYQVWKFGPALLKSDGSPKSSFNTGDALLSRHPRTAIGYYEPGHYCFVVVDGRQRGYSDGVDMARLSEIFYELGCKSAYNLDGGASSAMYFNGSICSRPVGGGREVSDIVYIREAE